MAFEDPLSVTNNKEKEIARLRAEIAIAKKYLNEDAVAVLEAELNAVEKGEKFNREEFLINRTRSLSKEPKHRILKKIRDLTAPSTDRWNWDGRPGIGLSYDDNFMSILDQVGVDSFQELVDQMASQLGRKVEVLDLFGGAYFLDNLDNVSRMVGVRLKNIDEQLMSEHSQKSAVRSLMENPKRKVIEGNLYKKETWHKLAESNKESNSAGFNLIVCRPEGPFRSSKVHSVPTVEDKGVQKEEIFVAMLDRTLGLLSDDGGILFSQIPKFETRDEVLDIFWKNYVEKKEKEGYEFLFGKYRTTPQKDIFAVRRNKVPDKQ